MSPGNLMEMVKVEHLTKLFPVRNRLLLSISTNICAVDNISFEIERGKILGLVGESGCGKTTTAKLLARLLTPTSGNIYIKGADIAGLKRKALKIFRKNIQMIFQDPYESLNPRFTVHSTIAEPLKAQGLYDIEKIHDSLEVVGLTPPKEFLFRYPHELSGGQRQRVAIARALVIDPIFVVADEPASMLDVSIRAGVLNLLLDLREKYNLTLLFITHDLAVARYMCDNIAVMYNGKIVELGKAEAVIKNPKHSYTKALLAAVPIPNPKVRRERIKR
ncbi:MAG: ATP-binding cassette domain-containing protein [Spirochaeta sp.]|nr:ATP-binding cassette domain-containing protein [Spirochaeta sp.]